MSHYETDRDAQHQIKPTGEIGIGTKTLCNVADLRHPSRLQPCKVIVDMRRSAGSSMCSSRVLEASQKRWA